MQTFILDNTWNVEQNKLLFYYTFLASICRFTFPSLNFGIPDVLEKFYIRFSSCLACFAACLNHLPTISANTFTWLCFCSVFSMVYVLLRFRFRFTFLFLRSTRNHCTSSNCAAHKSMLCFPTPIVLQQISSSRT